MKKIKIISKIAVVFSALIMVISFGIVVFNADYGIPLFIGEIGGIIFIISDTVIAIDAISQIVKKKNNQ
ncbi:MAG: hypothetical protein NC124_13850 [Clostridium sp.]|nr:hypothetical protein [Clostridium sp.]